MRLKVLSSEELNRRFEAVYGQAVPANAGAGMAEPAPAGAGAGVAEAAPPGSGFELAEVVRCELAALGVTPRRVLTDRVLQRLEPVEVVARERIQEMIQELEALGEITGGPGGWVAPTPLRAIQLTEERYLLVGTVPCQILEAVLTPHRLQRGIVRRLAVDRSARDDLAGAIQALGGRELTVAWWSGLEQVPAADERWLSELDRRLNEQDPAMARQQNTLWDDLRFYVPSPREPAQFRRWKRPMAAPATEPQATRLIRAIQPGGWNAYAWARPDENVPVNRLTLSRDEAYRTMFALDAQAGVSLPLTVLRVGDDIELELKFVLPSAEYRHLQALSHRQSGETFPIRYRVSLEVWPALATCLRERLNLQILEVGE